MICCSVQVLNPTPSCLAYYMFNIVNFIFSYIVWAQFYLIREGICLIFLAEIGCYITFISDVINQDEVHN